MSYPDYPNNRLIVGGVDLTVQYGLILVDGYTLDPPEPKTYEVDIPGGDGVIDLTDSLLGDTAYKNRKGEFECYIFGLNTAEEFERRMTAIKQYLQGKAFDFQITMDPEYTYYGRFTISNVKHSMYANGLAGYFKLCVDADPYKYLQDQIYRVNAVGGRIVSFESGRKRVRPVIESDGFVRLIYNGKVFFLPQGTWTINDFLFKEGLNEVYFNTYDIKNLTWGDLKDKNVTWQDFKTKPLFEWYKTNGDGTLATKTWKDLIGKTWSDMADSKWSDLVYQSEITQNIPDVYIKYKVGDL